MILNDAGIIMSLILVNWLKSTFLSDSTVGEITNFVNDDVSFKIVVIDVWLGSHSISLILLHLLNISLPNDFTDGGIETLVNNEQFAKSFDPMEIKKEGKLLI